MYQQLQGKKKILQTVSTMGGDKPGVYGKFQSVVAVMDSFGGSIGENDMLI